MIDVTSEFSSAKISLYGAQVLSFIPKGGFDVLMVSEKSSFERTKPIRGGIPLCFPWFGGHAMNADLPMHGFARLSDWKVIASEKADDGKVHLKLGLTSNAQLLKLWPFEFNSEMEVIIGKSLEMNWFIENTGQSPFEVTNALHTYFAVADVTKTRVEGLEGVAYFDSANNGAFTDGESHPLIINQEVNRLYVDTTSACKVVDTAMNRTILVLKSGSNSTIVWNPWIETSKKIADLGDDEYKRFLCVESGNVKKNFVAIQPGEAHITTLVVGCE
jgi:glucose-6-phosphate 1-epimerase